MALADDFARQFTDPDLRRSGFWREAISEGSISRTKTSFASEEMKSPGGAVFWVQPGETTNLKAQGWSQLSTGVKPRTGPSAEETRLATEQANEQRRLDRQAAERQVTGFGRTEAAYRQTSPGVKRYRDEEGGTYTVDLAKKIREQELYGGLTQEKFEAAQAEREAAEEQRRKDEVAAQLRFHIDNAATHPTDAIYAQYLSGILLETEVERHLRTAIEARLERMGIATGKGDPTVPGTGGVRQGTGLGGQAGLPAEYGEDLVDRMLEAELERLRNKFKDYIPQPNQGTNESDNVRNKAGYKAWQDRLKTGFHKPAPVDTTVVTTDGTTTDGTVVTTDAVVDDRTDFEIQQDLNQARRLSEERRIAAEIAPFTGTPGLPGAPDPGAIIGPGGLLSRQQLIEEQPERDLFLRGLQESTGRGLGGFIPVAQRAINRAFSRFQDVSPITNFFPQQERGASWRDYLTGPQPTAASLQGSLGNILNAFQNRPSSQSPIFESFSRTFGTPESAISAAAQPYLTKIAPRLRGAAQTGIFNMFGPQFAANPQQYQTPEQIFGVFKDFQSRGF
jgi:hypothetical protein